MTDYEMLLGVIHEALEKPKGNALKTDEAAFLAIQYNEATRVNYIRGVLTSKFTHEFIIRAFIEEWVKNELDRTTLQN